MINQEPNKFVILNEIIQNRSISTYYQPIISHLKRPAIIGLEALSRGYNSEGEVITPNFLFEIARERSLTVELDRLCREIAVQTFSNNYSKNKNLLLFLNFDSSIIDNGVVGSGHLVNLFRKYNINPKNVVIEIIESKVYDTNSLIDFVNTYRKYGCLIALDDIGTGYSNFERIASLKPDILKVDRSLISCINKDFYKQEIFKAIINLANKFSALVVAEGVESKHEAVTSIELGAEMLQGFYFAKPSQENAFRNFNWMNIDLVTEEFKNSFHNKITGWNQSFKKIHSIISKVSKAFLHFDIDSHEFHLVEILNKNPIIECAYILNEDGIQITSTVSVNSQFGKNRTVFFSPAIKGSNHSLKYYFLYVNQFGKHITEPYLSFATGDLCITASIKLKEKVSKKPYILCMDFSPKNLCDICFG